MIEFSDISDNVVVARLGGRITGEDVDAVVDEAESKLSVYEEIGVVADMTGAEGMTAEAIARDFAAQFKFLGSWRRFPRVAMIAESGLLEGLADSVSGLLPQIDVRTFKPSDSKKAVKFASGVDTDRIRA